MNRSPGEPCSPCGESALERYYRFHSRFYDATRWSFLFGRSAVMEAFAAPPPRRILEVGCGTGRNLVRLCRRFPKAELTGVDLSRAMLEVARSKTHAFGARVRLLHQAYGGVSGESQACDLVLFSYALSMFNPGCEAAIAAAHGDLQSGGRVAVVDFHDSRFGFFERWMGMNHVRMQGHLRPLLLARFAPTTDRLCRAYAGTWRYLLFVGRKE